MTKKFPDNQIEDGKIKPWPPRCELCGEPMPPGEEMFKFHGYSCDCPKPPVEKTKVICEYIFRDMRNGELWIDIRIDRMPFKSLGPFATHGERAVVQDDLLAMTRQFGAKDIPSLPQ